MTVHVERVGRRRSTDEYFVTSDGTDPFSIPAFDAWEVPATMSRAPSDLDAAPVDLEVARRTAELWDRLADV